MNVLHPWENHCALLNSDMTVANALKNLLARAIVVIAVPGSDDEQVGYRLLPGIALCDENCREMQLCELESCEPIIVTDSRVTSGGVLYYPTWLLDTKEEFYLVLEPLLVERSPSLVLPTISAEFYEPPVVCPRCKRTVIPSVIPSDGRYRCKKCKITFLP